jgi:hypothetical protein
MCQSLLDTDATYAQLKRGVMVVSIIPARRIAKGSQTVDLPPPVGCMTKRGAQQCSCRPPFGLMLQELYVASMDRVSCQTPNAL